MTKPSLEEILESETPYLDVFGVELRPKGRPSGAFLDYDTSLEVPSANLVENREEARMMRARVKARALAVVQAVLGQEIKAIYKAELKLEIARMDAQPAEPGKKPKARKKLISEEEAKSMPGSGLIPGETYWDWMQTMASKDDVQWASEKVTVKSNLEAVRKGGSNAS